VPPQDVGERQYLEQWSGGRCTRRCDGEIELLTNQACICIATDDMRCKPKTRLSVMLRDIEGLGTWRIESNGWGTASTLPGTAQFLMQHGGYVSATLYLQPRSRVTEVNGKPQTQNWMVPALEVEGITPGQLNGGTNGGGSAAVGQGQQRAVAEQQAPAISAPVEQAPLRDFVADIMAAETPDDVMALFNLAKSLGVPNPTEVTAAAKARGTELKQQAEQQMSPVGHIAAAQAATTMDQLTAALSAAQLKGFGTDMTGTTKDPVALAFKKRHLELASAEAGTADAPPPPVPQPAPGQPQEREALWSQIVAASPFDRTADLTEDFSSKHHVLPSQATPEQLATYLDELTSGTRNQTPATVPAAAEDGVPF
jgi:hypothetical protein